ncbi:hypothetical protein MSG28_008194 [Choristoneura fumiferana]|uniref:Uncharacterized protein n=2 Tax=Choristoneura fumiferana TaxID=7141 RepID=A0ACC0JAE1_CHOFU|nr:hypothetical protein MSG28_008194 [Choristoneura fumiferana]KAI8421074.1 hypothetical protein MSG28_008194 [Choristoneura fumiferana]
MSRFGNALLQLGLYRYMVFTVSRFGRPVIELGPHRFNKWAYSRGARASWTCVKQYKQCRARLVTLHNVIVKILNEHNH